MVNSSLKRAFDVAREEGFFELLYKGYWNFKLNSSIERNIGKWLVNIRGVIPDGSERRIEKHEYSGPEFVALDSLDGSSHPEAISRYEGQTFKVGASFYLSVKNASLIGSNNNPQIILPVTERGGIVSTSEFDQEWQSDYISELYQEYGWPEYKRALQALFTSNASMLSDKTVLPLIGKGDSSYMHWMYEYLPRLEAAEHYERRTGETPIILVGSGASDWRIESIVSAGFDRSQVRRWDETVTPGCDLLLPFRRNKVKVLLPDLDDPDYKIPSPSALYWLREKFLTEEIDKNYPKKIYLSRNDVGDKEDFQSERQVRNEKEVVQLLRSKGYKRIFPSEYSISEQAKILYNAEEIVYPHGSASTNFVFSRSPNVVEIFGKKVGLSGLVLSSIMGFDYQYIVCPENDGWITIDLDRLESVL